MHGSKTYQNCHLSKFFSRVPHNQSKKTNVTLPNLKNKIERKKNQSQTSWHKVWPLLVPRYTTHLFFCLNILFSKKKHISFFFHHSSLPHPQVFDPSLYLFTCFLVSCYCSRLAIDRLSGDDISKSTSTNNSTHSWPYMLHMFLSMASISVTAKLGMRFISHQHG